MKKVIWITGLSGAGKTTLAKEVVSRMGQLGKPVVLLDGDQLRAIFDTGRGTPHGHNREARLALAFQYGRLCNLLADQGITVVIATISLFKEVHAWNRTNLPGYFEVFLKVPKDELFRRDPKGIYKRFQAGELTHVAGLDLAVDEPAEPDWVINFDSNHTVHGLALELLAKLMEE